MTATIAETPNPGIERQKLVDFVKGTLVNVLSTLASPDDSGLITTVRTEDDSRTGGGY